MKPTLPSYGMGRRALLSTLAVLPALSIPMLTTPVRAQTATGPDVPRDLDRERSNRARACRKMALRDA
jgi:hypothetical protein